MSTSALALADLIASLDDDTALVAATALESSWKDKHSCCDDSCWGFVAYPVDWFRRILAAAVGAAGKPDPVFIDAGAGIGTKVLLAARAGCRAYGIEHNPHYVEEAAKIGADVREGDIRDHDYSTADIVWMNYPLRERADQIAFEADVAAQMKPGAVLMLGNRVGPEPAGWERLAVAMRVIGADGAWRKPSGAEPETSPLPARVTLRPWASLRG